MATIPRDKNLFKQVEIAEIVLPRETNIVPNPDGSTINRGAFASPNFITGTNGSGWRLDSNGNVEANDGVFRGELTASELTLDGFIVSAIGTFGGDGSDGALSITSGTTTNDLSNAKITYFNYSTIAITGTGVLAFSNPHATGSIVIIKCTGTVTLTSSATPMIDMSGMGAPGGAGASVGASANADGVIGTDRCSARGRPSPSR